MDKILARLLTPKDIAPQPSVAQMLEPTKTEGVD
jgi:hypothetical protein